MLNWSEMKLARINPIDTYVSKRISYLYLLSELDMAGASRGVAKGAQFPWRRIFMGAPNDCRRQEVPTRSQVLPLMSTFASERPQIRTWGGQTFFLPRLTSLRP